MKVIPFSQLLEQQNLPENNVKYVLVSQLPDGLSKGPAWKPLPDDYEKFHSKLPQGEGIAMVIKIKARKVKFIDINNRRSTESRYSYTTAVKNLQAEVIATQWSHNSYLRSKCNTFYSFPLFKNKYNKKSPSYDELFLLLPSILHHENEHNNSHINLINKYNIKVNTFL